MNVSNSGPLYNVSLAILTPLRHVLYIFIKMFVIVKAVRKSKLIRKYI